MSEGRRRSRVAIAASVLVGVLVFLFHLPFAQETFFFDDSADYIRASQADFVPTWLNRNSASPVDLVALRGETTFRARPWDHLYAANDNAALRHFHGPLSFYAMHAVQLVSRGARAERLLTSCVTAVTCGLMVSFLAWFRVPWPIAALLALLAGVQSRYIEASIDPTPHSWYMLFALCFLSLYARFLSERRDRDLQLCAVSLALAFATLEFSVELFACLPLSLLLIALMDRRLLPEWKAVRKPLGKAVGLFFLTTFVLWPGGWLRGGYFETYGVLSATVLFKNKAAFGGKLTPGVIYEAVFSHHALFLLLVCGCVGGVLVLLFRRRLSIATVVFASYSSIAFALGVADHFRLSTYVAEFLLFLIMTAGLVFADFMRSTERMRSTDRGGFDKQWAAALLSLLVAAGCVSEWRQRDRAIAFRPWLAPVIQDLRTKVPLRETVLTTDGWEALALYAPEHRFEPTLNRNSGEARAPERTFNTRYFLFDSAVQPATPSRELARYAATGGRTKVLWAAMQGQAASVLKTDYGRAERRSVR